MSRKIDSARSLEVGERFAALGAKCVGLVEDRGDPALLVKGRKRKMRVSQRIAWLRFEHAVPARRPHHSSACPAGELLTQDSDATKAAHDQRSGPTHSEAADHSVDTTASQRLPMFITDEPGEYDGFSLLEQSARLVDLLSESRWRCRRSDDRSAVDMRQEWYQPHITFG